ncbi:hypothetical protein T07_13844 [Trichinella nelsoni]|uniref:Uncharacterized protein n=1 Tax=Trichinella nelsoni TaxID=6336 RepID=A0A0V0SL43_9BILA|nr:hypothetical protein T07_13844 [Trichinella nelsoni]
MTFSTVVDPCKVTFFSRLQLQQCDVSIIRGSLKLQGSRADGGDCVQSSASGRNKLNPKGWSEVNNL